MMSRKTFMKLLTLLPLSSSAMNKNEFEKIADSEFPSDKMLSQFVGHGNPMYATSENKYKKAGEDEFQFFNDTLDMGSLSMRSALFS